MPEILQALVVLAMVAANVFFVTGEVDRLRIERLRVNVPPAPRDR